MARRLEVTDEEGKRMQGGDAPLSAFFVRGEPLLPPAAPEGRTQQTDDEVGHEPMGRPLPATEIDDQYAEEMAFALEVYGD